MKEVLLKSDPYWLFKPKGNGWFVRRLRIAKRPGRQQARVGR